MTEATILGPEEFYGLINLAGNPFRANPVYGLDPRMNIWVGYEKQKNQLIKFLVRSRSDQVGNINFLMLYGDYGVGKSHALLWAAYQIMHVHKTDFNSVCYLIPTLRKDKGKFSFAAAFADDLVAKATIKQDILDFRQFLHTCMYRYRDAHGLGNSVNDEEILERLIPANELQSLAKGIHRCERPEQVEALLLPKGLTDYQATTIFTRITNLFVLGYEIGGEVLRFKKAVYLMLDELDDLLRASAKEAREVNDVLRHLYDSCPSCFGLVIALSAEAATLPAIFMDYILGRINRQILLEQLSKDGAMEFVKEILDANRVKKDAKRSSYFPFEESAVEGVIAQLRQITPRKVISTMQQVLEEIRLCGYQKETGAVDLSFLDSNDILEEVLGDGGVA